MKTRKLHRELIKNGASKDEAEKLVEIAGQLSTIRTRGLSDKTKKAIADIPDESPKQKQRISMFWITSGVAMASAVFIFVFVGQSLLAPKQSPTVNDVQTHESEKLEIEKILDQSKTELEALQQAEVPEPEKLQEAEEKYEEALDRLDRWKSKNNENQENQQRRRLRERKFDVRGTQTDENPDKNNVWRWNRR